MPLALENRPKTNANLEQYTQAFATLTYFRDEYGKIKFADIVAYANVIGEKEVLEFVSIIITADKKLQAAVRESKELIGNQDG